MKKNRVLGLLEEVEKLATEVSMSKEQRFLVDGYNKAVKVIDEFADKLANISKKLNQSQKARMLKCVEELEGFYKISQYAIESVQKGMTEIRRRGQKISLKEALVELVDELGKYEKVLEQDVAAPAPAAPAEKKPDDEDEDEEEKKAKEKAKEAEKALPQITAVAEQIRRRMRQRLHRTDRKAEGRSDMRRRMEMRRHGKVTK